MKYLSKRQIQLSELEILKEFIRICEKYEIEYYLYAGTMLGAARHKGFIPWDDDIDVIVPRKSYNKLAEVAKNELSNNGRFEIVFPEKQKKPTFMFAKMFDKSIKLEADNGIDSTYLWIDIFQLDGLGDNAKNHKKNKKMLKRFFIKRFSDQKPIEKNGKKKTTIHKVLAKIRHELYRFVDYEKMVRKMEKQFQKYDYETSSLLCNNTWSSNEKDILKKEWVQYAVDVQFEGITAKVFNGYKEYLENRYGKDYMKLPPKEMRITHSFKAWKNEE